MSTERVQRIIIVGGGTAGWMTAAALAAVLGTRTYSITLVESDTISTVGVGEATVPGILKFNEMLGIDEDIFLRETHATFKLGIEFIDWRRLRHRYFHPFGVYGARIKNGADFTHYWLRWVRDGGNTDPDLFNPEALAASHNRFAPVGRAQGQPPLNYAYQFDAASYAAFLRRYAEQRGVERIEGLVTNVEQHSESGFITEVMLNGERRVAGDLFIDCSGFRSLLLGGTMETAFEDWSRWLPNNRAIAVPCANSGPLTPYTRATAREAGWQWRIPLQHRTGNGYVFSDAFISEDEATTLVMQRLDGAPIADPKILRFTAGKRRAGWVRNCIGIGLAGGFLEPLESTSIHLIEIAITLLIKYFPDRTMSPVLLKGFNRELDDRYFDIKDFLIAHFKVTERDDTPYWRHCREMDVPDSLRERLELFQARGEALATSDLQLFHDTNWFAILYGQGIRPHGYHPLADSMPDDSLRETMPLIADSIKRRVDQLPLQADYIRSRGGAPV